MSDSSVRIALAQELEGKRAGLMIAGDADGLAEMLSESLYFAHSSGLRDDKASYLAQFRAGKFIYRKIAPEVHNVIAIDDHAFLATGIAAIEVNVNGVEKRIRLIFLLAWRQEAGIWRLIANQTTLMRAA